MNTLICATASRPELRTAPPEQRRTPAPNRHMYRARDFGVGYGNSSGYASGKRYTPAGINPRFRLA